MAEIGHNQPPDAFALAIEPVQDMSAWLHINPVIQDETKAKEAKVLVDRVVEALREVEQERDGKVRPLNDQVAIINGHYKAHHNTDSKKPGLWDKTLKELKARIQAFMDAEEAKRLEVAAEAQRALAEAERLAREAEEKEREVISDAKMGVEGDVGAATAAADQAFTEFAKADRAAQRAERDSKVKVAGGFGRALAFRRKEILSIETMEDARKALNFMGLSNRVIEALLTDAREWRKETEELPPGITQKYERGI